MKIDGYFQSEKFFINNKDEIIEMFTHKETISKLKQEYGDILSNSVSIHFRRGDYVGIGEALELDYYDFALQCLYEDYPVDHVLIFSDDIDWCKKNIHYDKAKFITGNKDYECMYLMSLCTNNIVANSSFSWWGAYLNRNPLKRVFMPKPFTTSHGDDIYFENVSIINR
jgi:hypothetical protein